MCLGVKNSLYILSVLSTKNKVTATNTSTLFKRPEIRSTELKPGDNR